jgi:hypothetical protein
VYATGQGIGLSQLFHVSNLSKKEYQTYIGGCIAALMGEPFAAETTKVSEKLTREIDKQEAMN